MIVGAPMAPEQVLTAMRDEGHDPHRFQHDGWGTYSSCCRSCGALAEARPTEEGWELTHDSFTGRSCK